MCVCVCVCDAKQARIREGEAALARIEVPSASSPFLLSFFMVSSVDMLEATFLAPLALVCEMVPADFVRLL